MGLSNLALFSIVATLILCSSSLADAGDATTIIVGAGMSGIMAAKTLFEKGIKDFVILEATNRIGGRMHKKMVGGYPIEMGANWVQGVGSRENVNPIWTLANKYNLLTFKSNYDNISYNIYDQEGGILPQSVVAEPYERALASSEFSENLSLTFRENGEEDISILASQRVSGHVPTTPLEMAIDFFVYDYETAEPPRVTSLKNVEPSATFEDYGVDNYFVADSRGYEHVVHRLAQEFLESSNGKIIDKRLKLNKVVRKIEYGDSGVKVSTEDGSVYTAKNSIVSVSAGVLQTKLIEFKPDLPMWKLLAIYKWDMAIYCKIFVKFPYKFWPTGGPGTEFFMYVHERRGYYNNWQHLENEYPGGNLLMVTVVDEEARRIEQQPEEDTKTEIMQVLRKMFGKNIPEMSDILIPKWGQDRFYKGTFSNWPIGVSEQDFHELKAAVGPVFFSGEHTNQEYNGYVHGAYLAGIDTANMVLDCINDGNCANNSTLTKKTPVLADARARPEIKLGKMFGTRARRKAPVERKFSV
ncbi:polyamine oxidase 7 [Cryptomeria japonica]|uniref:polyamine oxidase 7 n=1 Tax=Cryptomeria japonica TaxID=3369 RepID=UPI0025AD5574|nr:polyamine oxidase 7 [Cryptomeria japonica]